MNKNLEKVCKYLIENKIVNEDLFVDFDEEILMYKEFEWDLNSEFTEVEVKNYGEEYSELVIEDCDQYKLTIDCYAHLEIETPKEDESELEELRRENSKLLYKIEMLEETNKDLANIINKRAEESENKRRIKALEEEVRRKYGDNFELPKITPWREE